MQYKEKKQKLIYNKNFRNNQNYIIWDLDKKFILYNFYKLEESYSFELIKVLLFIPLPFIIYYLSESSEEVIILVFWFILWFFAVWMMLFFLSIILDDIDYKILLKMKNKFRKKPEWILLKNNPNAKYKNPSFYTVMWDDRKIDIIKTLISINKDYTYINKN